MAFPFRHPRGWLFLVTAFVSGSLLTYLVILTPQVGVISREQNAPILHNLRVLSSVSQTLVNESLINFMWKETLVNHSSGQQSPSMGEPSRKYEDNYLKKIRVLCWIMTSPDTLMLKALHIKNTWGPRCDHILYMSSVENTTFPAVGLNVTEGRDSLWNKTRAAFEYIYKHNLTRKFDWFLKADDDTYVIVDNLKYFLRDKNSSKAVYYGHHFAPFIKNGYMSGGAGYVLSRYAVETLVKIGLNNQLLCPQNGTFATAEDLSLGYCMQNIGVIAGDSRDSLNRSRFLPFPIPEIMRDNYLPDWYVQYARHKLQKGLECCSDYLISCHYVLPHQMYAMDYFVYHLRRALPNSDHTYLVNKTRLPI
ncbi:glycoprotein-N-acetylgalactosamine 3-beta-galactosyltransferase 1-like [Amphiura filiformis]|uniref:glycoprotein-N-acetylgalactosamine 3-beta-galactosyltransferase 1-like n=1 Tax=Amphiura filiformis TaxID=82378 RepID=UPI003B21595D